MTYKGFISYSVFSGFTKTGDGGAIYASNSDFHIICSTFQYNTVTRFGGSIFLTSSHLYLSQTSFSHSKSTSKTQDISGNAQYLYGGPSTLQEVSVSLCSDSSEECSDSSIKISSSLMKVTSLNSSSNIGNYGAGTLAICSPNSGSLVEYINSFNSSDTYCIECHIYECTLSKSNIINVNKNTLRIFWLSANQLLTLKECCLYQTNGVGISSSNGPIIVDCITDIDNPSFTLVDTISLIPVSVNLICHVPTKMINKLFLFNQLIPLFINYICIKS